MAIGAAGRYLLFWQVGLTQRFSASDLPFTTGTRDSGYAGPTLAPLILTLMRAR